jgi:hypothetical protein
LQTIEGWVVANEVDVINPVGAEGDDRAGVNVINRAVLIRRQWMVTNAARESQALALVVNALPQWTPETRDNRMPRQGWEALPPEVQEAAERLYWEMYKEPLHQ